LRIVLVGMIAAAILAGCVHTPACSIQLARGSSLSDWTQLAQVSRSAAEQSALNGLHAQGMGHIESSNLASDSGCLVWSVDLSLPGAPGVSRVIVDAGDGHVLLVRQRRDVFSDGFGQPGLPPTGLPPDN
jgi:hypothetical protein